MPATINYYLKPIGYIQSLIKSRKEAPKQGSEGGVVAWLELDNSYIDGLDGLEPGDEIILITWFHQSRRDIIKLHPRGDQRNPITGVFATRSPDRPNPLGLHRVKLLELTGNKLKISPLEVLDGTPVMDIKPVLEESGDF